MHPLKGNSSVALAIWTCVVACIAVAAPSALANEVQVYDDQTHTLCEEVTYDPDPAGGCQVSAAGESTLIGHMFGMESALGTCDLELDISIDGAGEGAFSGVAITGAGNCSSVAACDDAPWLLQSEDRGDGTFDVIVDLCLDTPHGECSGEYGLVLTEDETELLGTDGTIGSGPCEATVELEIADTEVFTMVPVSVISTAATPTAMTLYTGALWATNSGNIVFTTSLNDTATCSSVTLKPQVVSTVAGGSSITRFDVATLGSCGGANIQWKSANSWRGTFNATAMRTTFTDVEVEWDGPINTCLYRGNLTSNVVNPTATTWLRFTFWSPDFNNLPAVPGSALTCGTYVAVTGTFDVGTDASPSANVWLVQLVP